MQVFSPGRTLTVSGVRQAPARNIRHVMIVAQPLSDNPDKRRGDRIEEIYQPYIDGRMEISEINANYTAPFVR